MDYVNTVRPRQNGRNLADDILKLIFQSPMISYFAGIYIYICICVTRCWWVNSISKNMQMVLLRFVLLWLHYQCWCNKCDPCTNIHSSVLIHWYWGNRVIAPVPVKRTWRVWTGPIPAGVWFVMTCLKMISDIADDIRRSIRLQSWYWGHSRLFVFTSLYSICARLCGEL